MEKLTPGSTIGVPGTAEGEPGTAEWLVGTGEGGILPDFRERKIKIIRIYIKKKYWRDHKSCSFWEKP